MNGRPGFFVMTPLRLERPARRAALVWVQRGWVARDNDDRTPPAAAADAGRQRRGEGRVAPPPARLFEFAADGGGPIRQNLDLDASSREARRAGAAADGRADRAAGERPDGLSRDWPAPAVDVQKHYGYAFQWFALCALIAGLYVWFQLIRRGGRSVTEHPETPVDAARPWRCTACRAPEIDADRRPRRRWKMLLVLAVCAAPVIASYLAYYVDPPAERGPTTAS